MFQKSVTDRLTDRQTDTQSANHKGQKRHWTTDVFNFQLVQDFIGTNLLTKFHDDRTINEPSRVLHENGLPPGGNVFQHTRTILELIQDIIRTNVLTKFHADWTINVTFREKCPPHAGNVFTQPEPFFKIDQDIIGTNLLTNFHYDQTINVASRVLTRKNAPTCGGHVFQPTGTIFKLVKDIIGTNLLDQTINVASRDLSHTTHERQKAITKAHHEHIVLR
ncbi:hypothetical protein DPMN_089199 [Dreissena polymorpha]|uniref:Uncharacterized protein n=1 Tax=Dreissena polymorpha TaxID=45954 RepID=A0A9D4KVI2_DREPO|nr:hypothetical protein DPMN_089199 [Dreissena polymorpha]